MTADAPDRPSTPISGGPSGSGAGGIVPYLVVFALFLVVPLLLLLQPEREGGVSALLRGPDDFMRLVQVIDWLDGQGWSDMVQRRLDPPAGVSMHWSRLADLPTAAVVRLTEPWLGRDRAVYLSALLVPPLLGALFAVAFLWAANCLMHGRGAPVPILMLGAPLYPLLQFRPGRVDHHGLQLVLTALAIGLLVRALATGPSGPSGRSRAAVGLGIVGGTSLAIGLETLPFLGAATVVLGLAWVLRGGVAAARLAIFGAAMTVTVLAALPLTLPRSEWTTIVCDRMSVVHVAITAVVAAAGAGAVVLERLRPAATRGARLAAVGGVGIAGLGAVAGAWPECAGGPYAGLAPEIRYWFDAVTEARSLLEHSLERPGSAVSMIILPLAALVVLALQRTEPGGQADLLRTALLVLVLSSVALLIWQVRGAIHAGLVASLALIPFAAAVNVRADRVRRIPARLGLRLCVPMICIAAVIGPVQLLRPASSVAEDERESGCGIRTVVASLTDPAGLGAAVRTIAAPIDMGPAILLSTRHRVLAAPYHRNARGLADHRRIFAGTEEDALSTARARGVDAIVFCREHAAVRAFPDHPAFLDERLAAGRPPWWLVTITRNEDVGIYGMHPAARHAVAPGPAPEVVR